MNPPQTRLRFEKINSNLIKTRLQLNQTRPIKSEEGWGGVETRNNPSPSHPYLLPNVKKQTT